MRVWLVLVLLALVAAPAWAGQKSITPQLGVRLGGTVNTSERSNVSLGLSPAYGLVYDVQLKNPQKGFAVLWSRQNVTVDAEGLLPDTDRIDLDIDYVHVGGVYRPRGVDEGGGFVMVTLGATRADPGRSGFDAAYGLSMSVGGGHTWPINKRLGFRAEGRGYLTFVTSSISGVCGGEGCSIRFSGGGTFQVDVLAGLTIGF